MKITKKEVFITGVVGTVLSLLAGYFYQWYWQFGISQDIYRGTYKSLFLFSVVLLIISLFLVFVREEVFRTWIRFACGWIPFSIIMIFLAGSSSGGSLGIPNVLDQEFVAIISAILFFSISLILILVKSLLLRSK